VKKVEEWFSNLTMPQISAGPKAHQGRKAHAASGSNKEFDGNARMIYSVLTYQDYDQETKFVTIRVGI
jgi:hypothetical protein